MTQYKNLIKNLVEDVARDDLGKAGHTFKSIMASKLMDNLAEQSVKVQNQIAEAYPEIFDSPVDVAAATGAAPSIKNYPADSEEDNIDPEEGKDEGDAHYSKGEDEEVYEQVVYEQGNSEDEELDEEDKPDFADIDGDGDEEESMNQAAKDKEQGAS